MPGPVVLTQEELAAAKVYMRVETDAEDGLVTACVVAAREYLGKAGVSLPTSDSPRRVLYNLACHAMALGSYDLRDPIIAGTALTENPQLRRIITQLKHTEPVGG